jgi:lipopolysaccharide transport system ATP-binding protein
MSTSDIAISVQDLSKLYHIGALQQRHDTLRDALVAKLRRVGDATARRGDDASVDTIWALKDVSFTIERGEVIGIIGRNGAGKSTLLKILSRITEPTSGRAEIHGRVGSLLEVGTGFHPELTGRENIYLNGAILGMRKAEIERQFDAIVAFAEIERFLDTPVKRYSSGMYVRLAFAVAAHLEPEILLVDEVLAVGDAAFQDKCLGKMGDVARSGRTVLFVSHNLGAVKRLCQRSLWIQAGEIAGLGRTDEIIGSYLEAAASQESAWRADDEAGRPQSGPVVVRSVRLLNAGGRPGDRFEMDSPFGIEMTYDVVASMENLRLGFTITSDDGTIVFESKDTDPAGYGLPRDAGSYVARCRVPGDFLNAGRFYVTVIVDRPHQELLFQRDQLLRFTITATDGSGARAGDTRYGLVRPILSWEHQERYREVS